MSNDGADYDATETTSVKTCFQFLFLSGIIPLLFFLRMVAQNSNDDDDPFLRYNKMNIPESLPEPFDFLPDLLTTYAEHLIQQQQSSSSMFQDDHDWLDSDIVELHHCKRILTTPRESGFWGNFTTWAVPLVNETLTQVHHQQQSQFSQEDEDILEQEIVLELIELYAVQNGYCNFQRYRPTIVATTTTDSSSIGKKLKTTALQEQTPKDHARCAFVIAIRYSRKDPSHVKRLIRAIHMPHHFIVLQLEEEAEQSKNNDNNIFVSEILQIAQDYDNVVVIQEGGQQSSFSGGGGGGTQKDRREDTTSNLQLKIMRWLTLDLDLVYDYHITMDGASFPLLKAEELAKKLYTSSQSVWLGTLTEQGQVVSDSQKMRLVNKRLATTSIPGGTARLGSIFPAKSSLPDFIAQPENLLNEKTTTGNAAVFSQQLVRQLLHSPLALQLFAMSKYGCCGTNFASYNWMAALALLSPSSDNNNNNHNGEYIHHRQSQQQQQQQPAPPMTALQKQARFNTAMFQLWGGTKQEADGRCNSAIRYSGAEANAILRMDPTRCYRIEHPQVVRSVYNNNSNNGTQEKEEDQATVTTIPRDRLTFHGGEELMKHIRHAKKVGFLFARLFDSTDSQSLAVLDAIEKEWITTAPPQPPPQPPNG